MYSILLQGFVWRGGDTGGFAILESHLPSLENFRSPVIFFAPTNLLPSYSEIIHMSPYL